MNTYTPAMEIITLILAAIGFALGVLSMVRYRDIAKGVEINRKSIDMHFEHLLKLTQKTIELAGQVNAMQPRVNPKKADAPDKQNPSESKHTPEAHAPQS